MIKAQMPKAYIAQTLGLHQDYCTDLINNLVRKHGLTYKPTKVDPRGFPPGITDESRRFRAKLGDMLYSVRQNVHHVEIGISTGLCNKAQAQASELPFNYDWRLGQLQRLAVTVGVPFKDMMLKALLTEQEYEYLSKCWTN